MTEQWKSPRAIEAEKQEALAAERQRQFALFDQLADLVNDGVITMEELAQAFRESPEKLTVIERGPEVERK